MEHDFLGYLLKALDPHDHAQVEAYLRSHPEAEARLAALRHTLAPLALDRALDAPAGLAARTLARIPEPALPPPTPTRIPKFAWPSRRLVELAVAVVCVLTVTGLAAVWIARIRGLRSDGEPGAVQMVECQDNLQKLFLPVRGYADTHQGQFPNVATIAPPRNVVAMVYPMLRETKLLPAEAHIGCPGYCPASLGNLDEIKSMDDATFQAWAASMERTYAYSLGYQSNGQIVGLRLDGNKTASLIPLMADNPPTNLELGNSPNHCGKGQHVLYADGHVTFCQTRHVGYNQDDIYLNRANHVAAGLDWTDTVLASGPVTP